MLRKAQLLIVGTERWPTFVGGREKLRFVGFKVSEEIIFDSGANTRYHIFFFFFLNRCMDFLEKRGKGKIFMEIGNLFRSVTIGDSLDCETLAYLSDNLNVSCGRIYNVFKTILFRCF